MRMIPRESKVKRTFCKGITLLDAILGLGFLALFALTVSSNFPWKWIDSVGIPMFLKTGDERIYAHAGHLLKYLFSRKFGGGRPPQPSAGPRRSLPGLRKAWPGKGKARC